MDMDQAFIQDLKQFIIVNVSQQISDFRIEMNTKIDNLSLAVGEAIDISNQENDKQLKNHEQRIIKLEQKSA